jgi:hypothetical protein
VELPVTEVVGLRFPGQRRLVWYRAGGVAAPVGSQVVASLADAPTVGLVVVGAGQCLSYGADAAQLPCLLRPARPEEQPTPAVGAGQVLLDSLP